MAVLSIDLASRRYQDIGIAVLSGNPNSVRVELVRPSDRGLSGTPEVPRVVDLCVELAAEVVASLILIDGPQGGERPRQNSNICDCVSDVPGPQERQAFLEWSNLPHGPAWRDSRLRYSTDFKILAGPDSRASGPCSARPLKHSRLTLGNLLVLPNCHQRTIAVSISMHGPITCLNRQA